MNRLNRLQRTSILRLLVEGVSLRSISRTTGHTLNTVTRVLVAAGEACLDYHNRAVRGVRAQRVQTDEIWSFTYCKESTLARGRAKRPPAHAGDTWTWIAIDADSKLLITWRIGQRDYRTARNFMLDLRSRLAGRVQLTTDGLLHYLSAVEEAFGDDVDYARLVKQYGTGENPEDERRYSPPAVLSSDARTVTGDPDPAHISTSYIERQNYTLRMSVKRFTRMSSAFSKRADNHAHDVALYATAYNFTRIHTSLQITPAMAAGLAGEVRDLDWIAELIELNTPPPGPRGPYGPRRRKGEA